MKVKDAIRLIIDSSSDIYSPGEAESIAFIILEFLGFPRKKIFQLGDNEFGQKNEDFIRNAVLELKVSRPVQYILGETGFYDLRFLLDGNVLIPRQETELLVQKIILETRKPDPLILDLGTGSGCIAVSLAKNIPAAKVFATDISQSALKIAKDNARLNHVIINFVYDDMLHTRLDRHQKFDIIVSNPPYVRDSEKKLMHENVLNFEPASALFVRDENPLEFYKAIALIAFERLLAGGFLYVEINENFGFEVSELFSSGGFSGTEIIRDIHEKDRFVKAVKK